MGVYEEKYKQLFDLAQSLCKDESDRIHRIDGKASRYISILTFFLGVCVIFIRFGIPEIWPLDNVLDKSVFVVFSFAVFILLVAWFFLIFALQLDEFESIQLDIRAFDENDLVNVQYSYTRHLEHAIENNREKGGKKAWRVGIGYNFMVFGVLLLLISSVLFLIVTLQGMSEVEQQTQQVPASSVENVQIPKVVDLKPNVLLSEGHSLHFFANEREVKHIEPSEAKPSSG